MAKVLVPLIDGFEEIEAITSIDLLRRAGIEVLTAGIGKMVATGSHAITIQTDGIFETVKDQPFDLILLPGGPGTNQLREIDSLQQVLKAHYSSGKPLAAICAAPTILAKAGLLDGKRATCYPTAKGKMAGAIVSQENVVVDANIITSRGAGTSVAFALEVVKKLVGEKKATELAESIIFT